MRSVPSAYSDLVLEPMLHHPWRIPWNEPLASTEPLIEPYNALVARCGAFRPVWAAEGTAAGFRAVAAHMSPS